MESEYDEYAFQDVIEGGGLEEDTDKIVEKAGKGRIKEIKEDETEFVDTYIQYGQTSSTFGGGLSQLMAKGFETGDRKRAFDNAMLNLLRDKSVPDGQLAGYMEQIHNIPRFWIRNPKLIWDTLLVFKNLKNNEPTEKFFKELSKKTKSSEYDLYRYYKLCKPIFSN
jgi:hypothetical protein